MKRWTTFSALPNYLGGKRRLIPEIWKNIPPVSIAPKLGDAFLGGGSVSLWAKAKGYEVHSNDNALRSYYIGKALIENDNVKITLEDIERLLTPDEGGTYSEFVKKNFSPNVFTSKTADFLNTALINSENMHPIMKLLIIKYVITIRPFGHFSNRTTTEQIEKRQFETAMKSKSHARAHLLHLDHPFRVMSWLKNEINRAVFTNNKKNTVNLGDVMDYLKQTQVDVMYFDPPYASASSYEETYHVLDCLLKGEVKPPEVSGFTKKDAIDFHKEMYDKARHIPNWVISMGQTESGLGVTPEQLLEIVQHYKPKAKMRILDHAWSINNAAGKKQKENVEYLIYTYEK